MSIKVKEGKMEEFRGIKKLEFRYHTAIQDYWEQTTMCEALSLLEGTLWCSSIKVNCEIGPSGRHRDNVY